MKKIRFSLNLNLDLSLPSSLRLDRGKNPVLLSPSLVAVAPVAQLDRASASGAEGHRFKSCQAHQTELARAADSVEFFWI